MFWLLKIHLEDESSTTKICFIRPECDIRLSRTIFEYLTYDSKKVHGIHNFIFGSLAGRYISLTPSPWTTPMVSDICRLQIADYRLQTADCRLQITDTGPQTVDTDRIRDVH